MKKETKIVIGGIAGLALVGVAVWYVYSAASDAVSGGVAAIANAATKLPTIPSAYSIGESVGNAVGGVWDDVAGAFTSGTSQTGPASEGANPNSPAPYTGGAAGQSAQAQIDSGNLD